MNVTLTAGIEGLTQMQLGVDMNAYFSVLFVDTDLTSDATIDYSFYDGQTLTLEGTWSDATFEIVGWDWETDPVYGSEVTHSITVKAFYAANRGTFEDLSGTIGFAPISNSDFSSISAMYQLASAIGKGTASDGF